MLALQLTLDLLGDRLPDQPVPVLLQLASWDPFAQDLRDWLADQLVAFYLRSGGVAGRRKQQSLAYRLLDNDKVLPVLDGLDEIPEALRGKAISRLNETLTPGEQRQLLITSRVKEYEEAIREAGWLAAAAVVEIQPLEAEDVVTYLRASGGGVTPLWKPVIAELSASPATSPVAQALTTPLMVTLAAAVYNPMHPTEARHYLEPDTSAVTESVGTGTGAATGSVRRPQELLDLSRFHDSNAVKDYLLDTFIPALYGAYDANRLDTHWTPDQAVRWHIFLACHLARQGEANPNLGWWELWHAAPRQLRSLTFGLAAGVSVWLGQLLLWPYTSTGILAIVKESIGPAVVAGLAGGWVTGAGLGKPPPHPSGWRLQRNQVGWVLVAGLAGTLLGGILSQLAAATGFYLGPRPSPVSVLLTGLASGLLVGLVVGGLILGLVTPAAVNLKANLNPHKVLARDRTTFVVIGLISWPVGIAVAAFVVLMVLGIQSELMDKFLPDSMTQVTFLAVATGYVAAFSLYGIGLVWGWSRASWGYFTLARGWLAFEHRLPWRLMPFLEDANKRGVLRQIGPYYQFRHPDIKKRLVATERNRLAATETRPVQEPDRSRLIRTVQAWRIEQAPGVWLRRAARLRAGLEHDPCPVRAEFRTDPTAPGVELSVQEAFERTQGRLLIVGEPGSGKTTLAVELLGHLLARARADPTARVPELFPLASWTRRPRPLGEWLEDELRQRGFDPRWVREGRLIPILDGLDEVDAGHRSSCLRAINDYGAGRPLVLTCRLAEYQRLVADRPGLAFGAGYVTQPLRVEQISEYLEAAAGANPGWGVVRDAIVRRDAGKLCRLLRTPLMLSVAVLAYAKGDPSELLGTHSPRERVWDAFVEAMRTSTLDPLHANPTNLETTPVREAKPRYTSAEVRRWLGWLASSPTQRGEIWLHRLEPPPARHLSPRRAQSIAAGLIYGLLLGLGLGSGMDVTSYGDPAQWLGTAVVFGGVFGGVFGVAGALISHSTYASGPVPISRRLISGVAYALTFWLAHALALELSAMLFYIRGVGLVDALSRTWSYALIGTWSYALIFGLAVALAGGLGVDPSYASGWSVSRVKRSLRAGLVVGLVAWLIAGQGLGIGPHPPRLVAGLAVGAGAGLVAGLVAGLAGVGPLLDRPVGRSTHWLIETVRSGLISGLVAGLVAGLLVGLLGVAVGQFFQVPVGVLATKALTWSVFGLMAFGLIFGLAAALWHGVLRLRCWRRGLLPLRLVAFLGWSADHLYLQRSGGAYRWAHPTFVDHLAESSRAWAVEEAVPRHRAAATSMQQAEAVPSQLAVEGETELSTSPGVPLALRPERTDQVPAPRRRWAKWVDSLFVRRQPRRGNDEASRTPRRPSPTLIGLVVVALALTLLVLSWALPSLLTSRYSGSVGTFSGHSGAVHAVVVTPDGRQVVSGSGDHTVRVWDLATGGLLRILRGPNSTVFAVAVTPDGRQVVSGSGDGVRVWDLATDGPVRTLTGHTYYVNSVVVTPDGRQVVSGSEDHTVRVWDLTTGRLLRTFSRHSKAVGAVAVTPDGRQVVSGSGDDTVRVWDLATGRLLRTFSGDTSVFAVAVTPDGRQVISGSLNDTVRVWDLATGRLIRTLTGHTSFVDAVAVTPDGRQVVSGSFDKTVRVWDLTTGRLLRTFSGHTGAVRAVAVTRDGRQVVSGSDDGTVQVWDLTRQGDR